MEHINRRRETMRAVGAGRLSRRALLWRAALLGLSAPAVAAALAACGTTQAVTNVVPTAQAAATTGATNTAGIAATARAAATTVATNASGLRATAQAAATNVAPTVNAVASQAVPTAQAAATNAAGSQSGPEATVKGKVTKVDVRARTFTLQGDDGKSYDFKVTDSSRADLNTLASSLGSSQEVEVTYRNTSPPYEVVSVR